MVLVELYNRRERVQSLPLFYGCALQVENALGQAKTQEIKATTPQPCAGESPFILMRQTDVLG